MLLQSGIENGGNEEARSRLLKDLKKEVKQIMEEAVTRKFVNEESSSVTSLCAAIDACLLHGLKKRVLGLFSSVSTFALLHKIHKMCPPAASVVTTVLEIQQQQFKDLRNSSGSTLDFKHSDVSTVKELPVSLRYLWIRIALFEKTLALIVEFIARNASRYYEKDALMLDSVGGSMVASLLVGPCALEYSKMKTQDHYWTDPSAEELLQRQKLKSTSGGPTISLSGVSPNSSSDGSQLPSSPRPGLQVRRAASLSHDEMSQRVSNSAREYVLSLHQNYKVGLDNPLRGYLSLHQGSSGSLSIRWTPNELMHTSSDPTEEISKLEKKYEQPETGINVRNGINNGVEGWHSGTKEGTIVLVGADGTQHPSIGFPPGQHPLQFLTCLENGLLPWAQLDPPLWLQRGKGKSYPKLRRKSLAEASMKEGPCGAEESADYVFRIVSTMKADPLSYSSTLPRKKVKQSVPNSRLISLNSLSERLKDRFLSVNSSPSSTPRQLTPRPSEFDESESQMSSFTPISGHSPAQSPPLTRRSDSTKSTPASSNVQSVTAVSAPKTSAMPKQASEPTMSITDNLPSPSRMGLRTVCESMRFQILSRAFYGWLAYCRHLRTVRTHLSSLVSHTIVSPTQPTDASGGLTKELSEQLMDVPTGSNELELFRHVYFGGMDPNIRNVVWPFLLGFYSWGTTQEQRMKQFAELQHKFETSVTEWLAVEAIIRQRDKEAFKAARNSRESQCSSGSISLVGGNPSLTNDVFEPDTVSGSLDDGGFSESSRRSRGDSERSADEAPSMASSQDTGFNSPLSAGTETPVAPKLAPVANGACSHGEPCDGETQRGGSTPVVPLNSAKCALSINTGDLTDSGSGRTTPEQGDGGVYSHPVPVDPYSHPKIAVVLEVLTYGCFCELMKRMAPNFPHGGAMDVHLANMRSLIQILDPELFELMHHNGDYTHFYFSYRWFLLDFKRELLYKDVFRVWETIWAARSIASSSFQLFIALSIIENYREIILDNNMDFTDIIKFFNGEHRKLKTLLTFENELEHRFTAQRKNRSHSPCAFL